MKSTEPMGSESESERRGARVRRQLRRHGATGRSRTERTGGGSVGDAGDVVVAVQAA